MSDIDNGFSGDINSGRRRKSSRINNLTWLKLAPGDVIRGAWRDEVSLIRRFEDRYGHNVAFITSIWYTKSDPLSD